MDGPQNVKWNEIERTSAKLIALSHQSERPGMKVDDLLSKSAVHSLSRPLYNIKLACMSTLDKFLDVEKFEKHPEQQTLLDDISQLSSKYLCKDLPCYHD